MKDIRLFVNVDELRSVVKNDSGERGVKYFESVFNYSCCGTIPFLLIKEVTPCLSSLGIPYDEISVNEIGKTLWVNPETEIIFIEIRSDLHGVVTLVSIRTRVSIAPYFRFLFSGTIENKDDFDDLY